MKSHQDLLNEWRKKFDAQWATDDVPRLRNFAREFFIEAMTAAAKGAVEAGRVAKAHSYLDFDIYRDGFNAAISRSERQIKRYMGEAGL